MFVPRDRLQGEIRSARLVTLLALVFLTVIGVSLPATAIRTDATAARSGALIGVGSLSYSLAQVRANDGYNFLAVDLGGSDLGPDALWRKHLAQVRGAQFPVWGWVRTDIGAVRLREILRAVPLDGLYVYGPNAVRLAQDLSPLRERGPAIVPVLSERDTWPEGIPFGVVFDAARFPGSDVPLPVLAAAKLEYRALQAARAKAGGDSLIAFIPLD